MMNLSPGPASPAAASTLRRDHRVSVRVIEVRFAHLKDEIDTFTVAKLVYVGHASPPASLSIPGTSQPPTPTTPTTGDGGGLPFGSTSRNHHHAGSFSSCSSPGGPGSSTSGSAPNLLRAEATGPISGFRKMSLIVRPPQLAALTAAGEHHPPKPPRAVTVGKSPVLNKVTDSAFFDHEFEADLKNDVRYIEVELWQKKKFKDSCLGSVVIPGDQLSTSKPLERWFQLNVAGSGHGSNGNLSASANNLSSASSAYSGGGASAASAASSPTAANAQLGPGSSGPAPRCSISSASSSGSELSQRSGFPSSPSIMTTDTALTSSTGSSSAFEDRPKVAGVTLRVRLTYWNEYILPLTVYKPLVNVLIARDMHVLRCMERTVEDRDEMARTLVQVMYTVDFHEQYLISVARREIDATAHPALLFRANSVASKSIDQFMKLVATPMLVNTLKVVVKTIISDNRTCELDRARMERGSTSVLVSSTEQLQENLWVLEAYVKWTVERIVASADECPASLRAIFAALRQRAVERWPDDRDVRYTVVSSFLFLRLFNAAVLGPKLFGLCDVFPNQTVSRTLTLLSKALQQLANQSVFDGAKEPYMTPLNPLLEVMIPRIRAFLDAVSTPPPPRTGAPPARGGALGPLSAAASATASPHNASPAESVAGSPKPYLTTSLTGSVPALAAAEAKSPGSTRKKLVKRIFGHKEAAGPTTAATTTTVTATAGSAPALADSAGGKSSAASSPRTSPLRKCASKAGPAPLAITTPSSSKPGSSELQGSEGENLAGSAPVLRSKSPSGVFVPSSAPPIPDVMKNIDIERQFSDLFRILTKSIDAMQAAATPAETPAVNRLAVILREIAAIKERRMSSVPSAALMEAMTLAAARVQSQQKQQQSNGRSSKPGAAADYGNPSSSNAGSPSASRWGSQGSVAGSVVSDSRRSSGPMLADAAPTQLFSADWAAEAAAMAVPLSSSPPKSADGFPPAAATPACTGRSMTQPVPAKPASRTSGLGHYLSRFGGRSSASRQGTAPTSSGKDASTSSSAANLPRGFSVGVDHHHHHDVAPERTNDPSPGAKLNRMRQSSAPLLIVSVEDE
ncbi:hypothetical protein H9P43_004257 [Blastocladiella emersonii ATCC 22665]|nr:hypothetical protein H9P43_004257 [Blastocladiella emersonii ATCC 22665]